MRRSGVATSTLLLALFLLQALFRQPARASAADGKAGRNPRRRRQSSSSCNLFQGTWVPDPSYPFYSSSACPFIDSEFDCIKYGRPDTDFLKFSWKPAACSIPRFDGGAFARRWAGKKIMLVGDSLSLNMWESLLCMIHASAPDLQYVLSRKEPVSFVRFTGGPTVFFYHTPYLVDVVRDRRYGRLLKLDSIQAGNSWKGMDMLIFNSWHWWTHRGKSQPWDYVADGTKVVKDMDRLDAFYLGMSTWARWVDGNVDVSKTKVFFQGISPTHYMGKEWNKARGSCSGETAPLPAAAYPAGTPAAVGVVNRVLAGMRRPAYLLDITLLSQLRKDAHPSGYSGGHPDIDCSHWCLPGLPDTWNQLLYAALATM